ncbi:MAG: sigma-70 family RNA polymerase sigma factor [bacterium]|nr:sigma-70 family RNA polymerase sigma factor [bacterium]
MDKEEIINSIKLSQTGNTEAFGRLFDYYYPEIHRYIYYRVGHQQDAEDVTASIFIKIWDKINLYDQEKASFRVWIYRVAHNHMVDFYRKKRETYELHENAMLMDPKDNPEILTNQEKKRLLEALNKLTPVQQQILQLQFFSDLSNKEIANIVDKKEGAIRAIQFRALRTLLDELKPYYEE